MLALALIAALALSGPGTLDRSFGHDGRVVTHTEGIPTVAGVESVGGGKLLLAGTIDNRSVVLIRYRRDGTRDKGFGRQGVSTIRFDHYVTANDTVLDAQGRLLVAGSLGEWTAPGPDALVLRFDRAGHLDPTFDGDGMALIDFGGAGGEAAQGMALMWDGSIVVAAKVYRDNGTGGLGVTRLDSSGRVEPSFGEQGFVRREPGVPWGSFDPAAVSRLPDGRLAVAFSSSGVTSSGAELLRLLPNGTPDPSYDRDGQSLGSGYIEDLVMRPSTGRLLLTGIGLEAETSDDVLPSLLAIDPNAPSPAWRTPVRLPDDLQAHVSGLAVDSKGRAVTSGAMEWWRRSPEGHLYGTQHRADMLVARVGTGGKIDRCFGKRGVARIRFYSKLSLAAAITIGEHGNIVIAGPPPYAAEFAPHAFEVARLHGGNCRR